MHGQARGVLRRNTLERRLFGWLLALVLVPALLILGAALAIGSRSVELIGTLGPWDEVATSGRAVFDAAAPAAQRDSALARALDLHQQNLSSSLTQARRWSFLGERAATAMPWAVFLFAIVLTAIAMWISRRIAREIARPIEELVGWAERMGRGEPLPDQALSTHEVSEVSALRTALRGASQQIASAQTRALETERVRAWGEMARRIAHEMKNPLTPLRLAAHRLARAAPDTPALVEPMEVIAQETARLDEMARQFALLGRPSAGPKSEIDITELVASLLSSDVPEAISTSIEHEPSLPHLYAHHDALQRAVRNLIRNAVEAVQSRESDGERRIVARVLSSRGGTVIEIQDTGGGIPADGIERIFEPDYTLKAGGTGLGLALVRQAVAAHEGTVSARNVEGGAVFEIWLPNATADAPNEDMG